MFGGESHSSDEPPDAVGSIPSSIRLPAVAGSRSRPRARMAAAARAASHSNPSIDDSKVMAAPAPRSEEHTSELQSLMRISYAVFCLKKKNTKRNNQESILKLHYSHKII